MAQQIFTAHGYDFVADTMDWYDSADAETASEKLGEIIASFSATEAAVLHGLLTKAANGEIEWAEEPKLLFLDDACRDVLREVTRGYASQTFDGHNCTIAAA